MTKEELDKIIEFLELRMIMRKVEGSKLNFEETQLIKLCELCSNLTKENKELQEKINTYENPDDLTLMFMYCDEKAKDKIKALQERIEYLERSNNRKEETIELERKENLELHNKIDKAIEYIESKNNGVCIRNGEEKGAYTFLLDFDKAREFVWSLLEILKDSDVDE